ncbi:MAG TPA: TetR/AcrR family transcriptional regulator [Lachnospiraceae bacterium]|jgi:AcrR family transcriptional regulator|nr:TetR/AcrR family transcriptional regulator [Bacillota bacterium]HOM70550.1 TetR/AcrR family transcriptional regulator [Smithellaceae bacterium]HUM84941.1 TetR/AcrR family transcriptional regulator [Lachnospiraceae bacterium]
MPKTFTDKEREYIKKRLMEEAQDCLRLYGIRKTTVDELVKRANIPKGTFYLFYDSKELLFYDVLCSVHDELHADLRRRLEALDEPAAADQVTELVLGLYKKVEASFLYKFITGGDLELLMRRLPPEVARAHAEKDDFSMEQLIAMAPGIKGDSIKKYSAAMRAIFLSMLHKHEIGEEVFEDALRLMIRGVVMQMFEEGAE